MSRGVISRAQKYTIKCKMPWIFGKKIIYVSYNKIILVKKTTKPIYSQACNVLRSKYMVSKTNGNNNNPSIA